jgi:energy-coupling factor transporter transmembrane protein EcfT
MGKDGTQLLRHCVRLLLVVATDLLSIRQSGTHHLWPCGYGLSFLSFGLLAFLPSPVWFLCCPLTHSGVVNNFHFLPRSFFKLRSCKELCIILRLFLVSWAELIKPFFVLHESSGLALSETGYWHKIMCNGYVICRHLLY